ncbi:MAG: protein kinase [Acidimicrobiia bacterium]|nr:protein kinase [Acidimicrobiia bacterium]
MEKIGRYTIERVLGSGSFATVWLGHDAELDVDVAIKVLADNWVHDEDIRQRFLEEARILWRAQSPHIIRIHHIDVLEDGRPYMVMALADRGSLEDRMGERARSRRQFTIDEAVETSLDIASGLEAAHALDIVHRDLKPSAVLFQSVAGSDEPQLVLADFGIAKSIAQSKTTVATGTPHYMAPEQAEGRVDQRTDLYSAAVILYEMLAGRVPYAFESLTEVIRAQAAAPPTAIELLRPDTPPALAAAVAKALAHDPDDRFGSVAEWVEALQSSREPGIDAAAAAPPSPAEPPTESMAATMTAEDFLAAQASAPPEPAAPPPPPVAAAPPSPPPAAGVPPPPPPSRRKKKRGVLLPLIGLGVVAGAIVGALVFLTGGTDEGPDITEVFAEPVASSGIDPFTPTLVPQPLALPAVPAVDLETVERVVGLLNPPVGDLSGIDLDDFEIPGLEVTPPGLDLGPPDVDEAEEAVDSVVSTISGAAPGLYGGTEILDVCDRDALVRFMEDNIDKAAAWAGVQGIDPDDIPNFIEGLTDVVLQVDTRVTNHGFRDGVANPINSVLQAGTAVLVDAFGVPRVRCFCGNPLLPAIELSAGVTVRGTPWPDFDLGNTVVVQAIEEVLGFDLADILSELRFVKPVGSHAVVAPETTTTTAAPTTTTTIVLGTGDVQATLRWTGDADLDLHVIDPDGTEIFFDNARSPSGGTLDVDMVPDCGASSSVNVENVFWPEGGSIPGEYQAFVVHYDGSCGDPGTYELELKIDGEVVADGTGTLAVGEQSAPITATSG